MNIYILAVDHEIQRYDGRTDAAQKDKFEKLLHELVRERGIEFIGDETYRDADAIARHVANCLSIQWEPIEMSRKARDELGITDEQRNERYEFLTRDGEPTGFKTRRVLSDGIREEYMFWRTLTKAGQAQSILILCGFIHAEELRQRFEKAGHEVTTDSLCKRSWYTHPEC